MKLLDRALDLLFPPKCPFCQTVLEEPGDPVCPACQKSLPWLLGRAGERKVDPGLLFAPGLWGRGAGGGT